MKQASNICRMMGILLCLLLSVTGCIQHTAKENNDILVLLKEQADEDFASMNRLLNIAIEEKEYSVINYLTTTAIDSIEVRVGKLQQLNVPPFTQKFKEATLHYAQSLIDVSKAYKSYSLLSDSLMTVQQLDSIREMIRKTECTMDSIQTVLIGVQRDFAREKNIQL
ncbi:MAG: hypothetical protein LBV74_09125 [Tannerella sp.]|jgi:hypothetical protein|nr:hypothetical protein [Tannerella sp.]